jgi:hypothetical protein
MDQGGGTLAAQGALKSCERGLRCLVAAAALWLGASLVCGYAVAADAPSGIIHSASNRHAQLQSVYDLMAAQDFAYNPQEVDNAGERALHMSGDARIYALWHVLYAYQNDENEAGLIKWRDRIAATAQAQGDTALEAMARFVYQAYRNQTEDYALIDDDEWRADLTASDAAVRNIVSLERFAGIRASACGPTA